MDKFVTVHIHIRMRGSVGGTLANTHFQTVQDWPASNLSEVGHSKMASVGRCCMSLSETAREDVASAIRQDTEVRLLQSGSSKGGRGSSLLQRQAKVYKSGIKESTFLCCWTGTRWYYWSAFNFYFQIWDTLAFGRPLPKKTSDKGFKIVSCRTFPNDSKREAIRFGAEALLSSPAQMQRQ